jgi:threonine synthase
LYFKLEGCNPTGSFKDRGMVMAVAKALEDGFKAVACASTGNTSASATAYASAAGVESIIIIPKGKIALGKLAQAIVYGARIVMVDGNFDDALRLVREMTETRPVALVNSVNPYRIEGQKTAAFEICDVLGGAPDRLFLPVGNAGNITAYWKGFKEYHDKGITDRTPMMMGFQAAGAAPIVLGAPVTRPETIATAIRIGNPASWKQAEAARDESGGVIDMVTDDEILRAYHLMAEKGGIFGEPASAAPLAGLLKLKAQGYDFSKERIVCVVTGNGLKDADTAIKGFSGEFIEIPPDPASVEKALGW